MTNMRMVGILLAALGIWFLVGLDDPRKDDPTFFKCSYSIGVCP